METENIDDIMKELDSSDFGEKDEVLDEIQELDKKNKKNEERVSFFETRDFIYEQVQNAVLAVDAVSALDQKTGIFVKYNKKEDSWELVKKFKYQDKTYFPIIDEVFVKGGVTLPTQPEEYKSTKEITDLIRNFLVERVQLPIKPVNYEKFLPHLILFYWVYEKFPFIPYVQFVGGTGTGKTTAMETVGGLCYKAVDSTSSLTIASLFRIATQWRGTMLIDEFNGGGDNYMELLSFLKAGVSNRLLYRIEGEKTKEIKAYIVKSPKMFTSESPISDAGLQSRTIVIKMDKSTRPLPLYQLEEDFEECLHIRNKLLLWRLRHYNLIDLHQIKNGFEELRSFDKRVQQIITPIYYFSDEETKKDIIEFAKDQEEETLRSRRESPDGAIFEIINDIWKDGRDVEIKDVCDQFNKEQKEKGYKTEYTEKKIGNIVRKILGFQTERAGHNKYYRVIRDENQLKSKQSYYGIMTEFCDGVPTASVASTATEAEVDDIYNI